MIDKLDRVAIHNFLWTGIDVYWYGVIIVLAIIIGWRVGIREAKRTGQDPELYNDYLIIAVISSVIGARLYYVIFSWKDYSGDLLNIFNTRGGGLAIYGGIIGAIISAVIYTRIRKLNFWQFADTGCLGLIIGQAIGRIGNFFNREAFGGYTDSLFAMRYLSNTVSDIPKQVAEKMMYINGASYISVHPTFLYEFIWDILLLIGLLLYKDKKSFTGEVFFLYMTGYALGRFWIEGLRTDSLMLFSTGLRSSQVLAALVFTAGVCVIVGMRVRMKRSKK